MRKQCVNKKVIKSEISRCSFLDFLMLIFPSFSAAPHSFLIVNDFYVCFLPNVLVIKTLLTVR